MKNLIVTIAVLISIVNTSIAQEIKDMRIPLLGEITSRFSAPSTTGKVEFPADFYGKWKILFFHPADFTPVCTSEIIELALLQDEFKKLNTSLIVISTDGLNSHIEWVKSIESFSYKENKSIKINFPLVSDAGLEISKKFGMLHPYSNTTKDVRGVFIIDPENRIQAMNFYPNSVGRNIDEIKRTLEALQATENKTVLTPANWKPGDDVLIPSPASIVEAEKLKGKNDPNLQQIAWYMWYKKN